MPRLLFIVTLRLEYKISFICREILMKIYKKNNRAVSHNGQQNLLILVFLKPKLSGTF